MSSPADYGVLLTTVPSRDEAAKIAHLLLNEQLVGCVHLLPIDSLYI